VLSFIVAYLLFVRLTSPIKSTSSCFYPIEVDTTPINPGIVAKSFPVAEKKILTLLLNNAAMTVLQIEHKVPDYKAWKIAFDSDPIDRRGSGVKSYCIYRPATDQDTVIIDLVFDRVADAESTLDALRKLWNRVEGTVMLSPKARVLEVLETREYQ